MVEGKKKVNEPMAEPVINLGDLEVEERLQLLEKLWASLSGTPESLPLTDAQDKEGDVGSIIAFCEMSSGRGRWLGPSLAGRWSQPL
jgi:hypothetical protein